MPSYFPNKRNRPLGGGINPRAASNRGGRKYNFSGSMDPAEYSMMMRKKKGDALADAYGMDPEQFDAHMRDKISKATNFVSGGRKIGEGVAASAKSNIVGFKRGGVRGSRKGLDALIKTLSSNITSNVENIQNNVTNFGKEGRDNVRITPSTTKRDVTNVTRVVRPQVSNLNSTVNNVRNQSFNTIKSFRTAGEGDGKEDTGLKGTFGRLKDSFELLNLLTGKGIQEQLRKSVTNLEQFFTDAYRVAYRLRSNLLKIFKALRRIEDGSQSGGIKKAFKGFGQGLGAAGLGGAAFAGAMQRPRGAKPRRGRGRAGLLLGLGAGALGAGMATNALAGESPQIQSAETAPVIPEGFIDRFQGIIEKFGGIIDGLLNAKPKPAPGGGSGISGGASADPGSTDSIAGSMSLGGGAETPEEQAWLKTIRKAEGTAGKDGYGTVFGGEVVPELAEGKMTVNEVIQLQKTGKMPERLGGRQVNFGEYDGRVSGASGAYQFMPKTLEGLLRNTGTSGDAAFTPKMQDQFALELLRGRGIDPTKAATIEGMNKAQVEWAGLGTHHGQTKRTTAESLRMYNTYLSNSGVHVPVTPPPAINPSGDQSSARSLQSRSIARTAASQRQTNGPTIIPMNLGSQKQTPATAPSSQPIDTSPAQRTAPIPNLPAGDSDNFFAMSSKLAYNIVE